MTSNYINQDIQQHAKILWDYHNIPNNPKKADFILALGSNDIRVANEAARLILSGFAPILIVSGAKGKITNSDGGEDEVVRFSEAAITAGVNKNQLLLENQATNTGENFTKTKALLEKYGLHVKHGIFVTKPYMKRRALATGLLQWANIEWIPHSPDLLYENYPNDTISSQQMIELMVGDLQRMRLYPKLGFQVDQEIPDFVWEAYEYLVKNGFDRYVIK